MLFRSDFAHRLVALCFFVAGIASWVVNNKLRAVFPTSETTASGGVNSVLRSVELTGDDAYGPYDIYYNYYYDGANKRTSKEYLNGATEYFFYDQSRRLISEKSFESTDDRSAIAIDEYIYLGGVPVAAMLGQLSRTGSRNEDLLDWCSRRNVERACGLYHVLSDYQGTPIVTFNPNLMVSGVGEYDLFGHRNRRKLSEVETAHPHKGGETIASNLGVFVGGSLETEVRLRVSYLDADGPSGFQWYASVDIADGSGPLSSAVGTIPNMVTDFHKGDLFSAEFRAEPSFVQISGNGAVVDAFEYERVEKGAGRYFPPLRFPGQYYDEETDFHENWNRFYDPGGGRYLSPEPLLQSPAYVRRMAQTGMSVPTYAYALNNPLRYTDPTGLDVLILYGNPEFNGVGAGFSRSSYENALRSYYGPKMGESNLAKVHVRSAEAGFSAGALSDQPGGGRWDHAGYVGHGMDEGLWLDVTRGNAAFPTQFARWFGGRSPKQVSIYGCNAGGRDAAFRVGAQQLLPFSRFNGIDGSLEMTVNPTVDGQFGGFRDAVPAYPTLNVSSWAESNGWGRPW